MEVASSRRKEGTAGECEIPKGQKLIRDQDLTADFIHKLMLAQKELKESRVWRLFASRLAPGSAVDDLRAESRELLLMIGKSNNTAVVRSQGKTIGCRFNALAVSLKSHPLTSFTDL